MRQKPYLILFFCLIFIFSCRISHAAIVSAKDLVNNPQIYDNQSVEFSGEVIGEIMKRGENTWINVRDASGYAIGIWLPTPLVKDIEFIGGFNAMGDKIKVNGIFRRCCPLHHDDLDIHAATLKIESIGHAVDYPLNQKEIIEIIVLGVLALCLSALNVLRKKRAS